MIRLFQRLLARLDDRANPIVVKEIRTGMRARMFLIFYFALLLGTLLLSLVQTQGLHDAPDQRAGLRLFAVICCCLTFAVMGAVPVHAFRAMQAEREQNTLDVLMISGLKAKSVVWGKFLGSMLLMTVFVSALVPFMVFSYLLRGIDILTIPLTVAWILATAMMLTMGALWLGAAARQAPWTMLLQMFVIGGAGLTILVHIGLFLAGFVDAIAQGLSGGAGFWAGSVVLVAVLVGVCFLLYSLAVSQLLPDYMRGLSRRMGTYGPLPRLPLPPRPGANWEQPLGRGGPDWNAWSVDGGARTEPRLPVLPVLPPPPRDPGTGNAG
jgi:hypothetical protein